MTGSLAPDGGDLVGVVEGFVVGDNLLELKPSANARSVKAQLLARNHPQAGPIFSGPQQQPFVCTTARNGLGQPQIDNQDAKIRVQLQYESKFAQHQFRRVRLSLSDAPPSVIAAAKTPLGPRS